MFRKNLGGKLKILLTGASGFAGSHMLNFLFERTDATIYCPVTYQHGGNPLRILQDTSRTRSSRVKIFDFDLAQGVLSKAFVPDDLDFIINFASESHVDRSISNPLAFLNNNHSLMLNVLEYVRGLESRAKLVHISTDEVYGEIGRHQSNSEWEMPLRPTNPYSGSKSAQEELLISYAKTYGLDAIIINSTNMIGEGQNLEKFIPQSIAKILRNETIEVHTNSSGVLGSRRYVYVGDVVRAVWLASTTPHTQPYNLMGLPSKFHVAGNKDINNLEIIDLIGDILNTTPKIKYVVSPRPAYDASYQLTFDRITSLGWAEEEPIEAKVSQIVKWYQKNNDWLKVDYKSVFGI